MPKIIIRCHKCKRILDAKASHVDGMGDIVIEVTTCIKCIPDTCGICSECEEAKQLREIREVIK